MRPRPRPSPSACAYAGVLVLLALALRATGASPSQCCAPGVLLRDRRCADGSEIALNCTYRFLLDTKQGDKFVIRDDGKILMENVTYTEPFCLARMPQDVAVVCQDDQEPEEPDPRPDWWFGVLRCLSWLSVCCLAVTLAVHALLPELGDLQDRCHMGAVASLGSGLLLLSILQDTTFSGPACTAMAFASYYCWLSAFVWLHITSFNVWRTVVLAQKQFKECRLLALYCAAGCGLPLVLLGLLAAAHFLPDIGTVLVRPHIGKSKCWFHDDRATWVYFYGPSSLLIAPNMVYFVWTTARLWQQYDAQGPTRRQQLRRRFALSLKLFLVMGISWVFELISSASEAPGHFVWYLTDLFNAMQGLVILVVLVLGRRRVWRALYRRQPCGWRPPQGWAGAGALGDSGTATAISSTDSSDEDEDDDEGRGQGAGAELKVMGLT